VLLQFGDDIAPPVEAARRDEPDRLAGSVKITGRCRRNEVFKIREIPVASGQRLQCDQVRYGRNRSR